MKPKKIKLGRRVPRPPHVDQKWKRPRLNPRFRRFLIKPDPKRVQCYEVRVFRTRREMQAGWQAYENRPFEPNDENCMGRCTTYGGYWRTRSYDHRVMLWRHCIGRIYYNEADLLCNPAEILSHEVTHAAMGWARYVEADLSTMPGEEIMCYAQGRMMLWVNHHTRFVFKK